MGSKQTSYRELIKSLLDGDARFQAADFASTASLALWGLFELKGNEIYASPELLQANEAAYPGMAAESSLAEHFNALQESGDPSVTGCISGLKGKMAEHSAQELLQSAGYTDVQIAVDPTQEVWDITALDPSGEDMLIQVKTGGEGYASQRGSQCNRSKPGRPFHGQLRDIREGRASFSRTSGPDDRHRPGL